MTHHPLVAAVLEAAEENPDKISEAKYVINGQPECIVGVALVKLGVTVEQLEALQKDGLSWEELQEDGLPCPAVSCPAVINPEVKKFIVERTNASDREISWVAFVQRKQDAQCGWGTAVSLAGLPPIENDETGVVVR